MQLTGMRGHDFEVRLSYDELLIFNNALNEVCNGIGIPEFHARMGTSLDDVQRILETVGNIIEGAERGQGPNRHLSDVLSPDGRLNPPD